MEINRAAFGALAVFGVVAASGGAYLANRPSEPVLVQSAAPAAGLVTETENSIGTTPAAIAESQAPAPVFEATPAPAAAPSRRAPAPVRTAPAAEGARTTARRPSQCLRRRMRRPAHRPARRQTHQSTRPSRRRSSRWNRRPSNARRWWLLREGCLTNSRYPPTR